MHKVLMWIIPIAIGLMGSLLAFSHSVNERLSAHLAEIGKYGARLDAENKAIEKMLKARYDRHALMHSRLDHRIDRIDDDYEDHESDRKIHRVGTE